MPTMANRFPRVGDVVKIPRTTPGHDVRDVGKLTKITYVGTSVATNVNDIRYVWCNLGPGQGVWASHTLGFKLPE